MGGETSKDETNEINLEKSVLNHFPPQHFQIHVITVYVIIELNSLDSVLLTGNITFLN